MVSKCCRTLKNQLEQVKAWYLKNKSKAVFMFASDLNPEFFVNTVDMDKLRQILKITNE